METIIPDAASTITVAEALRWLLIFLLGLFGNLLSSAFKSAGNQVGETISLLFTWLNSSIRNRVATVQQKHPEHADAQQPRDELAQNP